MSVEKPSNAIHIAEVLSAKRLGDMSLVEKLLLERERFLYPHVNASGRTPEVTLGEKNWADFCLERYTRTGIPPRILEIGAGDTCTPWTASIDDERLDNAVRRVRVAIPQTYVVAQSGCSPGVGYFNGTSVNEFYSGHFYDVLSGLIEMQKRFDVILSRHALYMTSRVLRLLPMIDDLLSPDGAAFLDTVSKGVGSDRVLIYPKDDIPTENFTREDVWRSLGYANTSVGGLRWKHAGVDGIGTAWNKGELDRARIPSLVDVHCLHDSLDTDFFDYFRLIYEV